MTAQPDGKPAPCRVCGTRSAVVHITEQAATSRQEGPWSLTPVEQPERHAVEMWDLLHHAKQHELEQLK